VTVAKFHPEAAFHDQKHFVLIFVMVKDELALELVELHMLSVELGADVGFQLFSDFREFFGDVDFGHDDLVAESVCFSCEIFDCLWATRSQEIWTLDKLP